MGDNFSLRHFLNQSKTQEEFINNVSIVKESLHEILEESEDPDCIARIVNIIEQLNDILTRTYKIIMYKNQVRTGRL